MTGLDDDTSANHSHGHASTLTSTSASPITTITATTNANTSTSADRDERITPGGDSVKSDLDKDNDEEPSRIWALLSTIFWTPPWCRWNPNNPPAFSIWHNVLFAFAGAFTVANLYYSHPILNILADDFNVSQLTVSRLPTLMQAGYAVGLLFLCPLGDLFPRRPFTLILVFFTATLWIALPLAQNFNTMLGVGFITAVTTVTPQIMLPLVGELAPPSKKAFSLSIVVSGNLLGIVLARILSGVVTNYTSWRNIYWLALGLQYTIFTLLYLFMPAYPATNPTSFGQFWKAYPKLLWSILVLVKKWPVLTQAGMVSYCTSAAFTSYWTTLTFLLASPFTYGLGPVPIGLFGLIGAAGILLGPLYAQYIIQPLKVPMYSVLIGNFVNLVGIVLGTYTGTFTLAGPIIQAFLLDAGMQFTQIANRTSIYAVEPTGRNRINTAFMVMSFLGQLTGTAAGNKLFEVGSGGRSERAADGWIASGSLSVGLVGVVCNLICIVRGPYEEGWIGWSGGWGRVDSREKNQSTGDVEDSPQTISQNTEMMASDKANDVGRSQETMVDAEPEKGAIQLANLESKTTESVHR